MIIFWLALFVILLIIEIITVGLTTIWFAGGSMAALIVAAVGGPVWLQVILFLVVSFVLLFFTRPWAVKYLNPQETGTAVLNGQEWTARSNDDAVTIEADTTAEVVAISGVKLIVKPQ